MGNRPYYTTSFTRDGRRTVMSIPRREEEDLQAELDRINEKITAYLKREDNSTEETAEWLRLRERRAELEDLIG
jgi:hypothetical protein